MDIWVSRTLLIHFYDLFMNNFRIFLLPWSPYGRYPVCPLMCWLCVLPRSVCDQPRVVREMPSDIIRLLAVKRQPDPGLWTASAGVPPFLRPSSE